MHKQNPHPEILCFRVIMHILQSELNETAVIATYKEHEPNTVINNFKYSTVPWIVSVGMISEGTDVPRLQVCCHLTRIKTELHFRQILGRILRVSDADNQDALLFMPAERRLIEYANRVAEDIPYENSVVKFDNSTTSLGIDHVESIDNSDESQSELVNDQTMLETGFPLKFLDREEETSVLSQTYEATLDVFGQFHQEILTLNLTTFEQATYGV